MTQAHRPPPDAATRTRRTPLRVLRALAVFVALVALALPACKKDEPPKPNVLLVILDTVRADRCSLHGYARPTTPHLDALARDGVTYDDAWSPASWTAPAHAALFTGMEPHHLQLYQGTGVVLTGAVTLAERLAADGWDTGAFSANPWIGPHSRLTRGFSTERQYALPGGGTTRKSPGVIDDAIAWIRFRAGGDPKRPYFAFVNLMDAHAPYDPPADETARFLRPGLPPAVVAQARTMNAVRGLLAASLNGTPLAPDLDAALSDLYDGCVAAADAQLGRLLDVLRTAGTLDRTMVIVASDHGEGLGDHGWREHGMRLHRELLRVPLVVRMPGRFDGGKRVPDLVRLTDVMPTVLAACGVAPVPGLDGRDFTDVGSQRASFATDRPYGAAPMLASESISDAWRKQLEVVRRSGYDGRFHVILDDPAGPELYDVVADPKETTNLAGKGNPAEEPAQTAVRTEFDAR